MIDAQTRNELASVVRAAIKKSMSEYEEVWLTEDELLRQFQFLTKGWMKKNGHLLPRTHITLIDKEGKQHNTGWAYARNKIQDLITNDKMIFYLN